MSDTLACSQCGKPKAEVVESMPLCSLRYRLISLGLCHGHKGDA